MEARARWALVGYLVVLTTATHWPKLEIDAGPPSTDKVLHCIAFGLLPVLLWLTGWFRSLWTIGLIALLWTGLDELTQALPGVERSVTWQDFTAGVAGIVIALVGIALVHRLRKRDQSETTDERG